jgi:hypothetical protein
VCEARTTKRSTEAAYRLARRQLSSYQRPIVIASSENRDSTIGGPVKFYSNSCDSPEPSCGIKHCVPNGVVDGTAYQQQQLHLTTPPEFIKGISLTPQENALLFGLTSCHHFSTFPSTNPAAEFQTFTETPFPQYAEIQLSSSAEDFVYSGSFENLQASYMEYMTPDINGYAYVPAVDYSQLGVAGMDYASLSMGQDTPSPRPSRSFSLNSSESSTF